MIDRLLRNLKRNETIVFFALMACLLVSSLIVITVIALAMKDAL